jgi:hypothetical protein
MKETIVGVVRLDDWFRAISTPPDWGRAITQFSFPKSIPITAAILKNGRPVAKLDGCFLSGRSCFLTSLIGRLRSRMAGHSIESALHTRAIRPLMIASLDDNVKKRNPQRVMVSIGHPDQGRDATSNNPLHSSESIVHLARSQHTKVD